MSLPATDSFDRANGGLGSNWTTIQNAPQIISNMFSGSVASDYSSAYWNADVFANDQYAKGTPTSTFGSEVGTQYVLVRAASGQWYGAGIECSTDSIYLQRFSGGSVSTVQIISATGLTLSDLVEIRAIGTTIRVFRNGPQVGTDQSDSTLASGSAGACVYSQLGDFTVAQLDNWEGGNIVTFVDTSAVAQHRPQRLRPHPFRPGNAR
jgi:hypothetical protein